MANIHGTNASESLTGVGFDDDWIYGYGGHDVLLGGYGDDWLFGHDGNDLLYGEQGQDWLFGGSGDDVLRGMSGDDKLYGGDGDDLLRGGTGADFMHGGNGFDVADYSHASGGVVVSLATGQGTYGEAAGDVLLAIEGLIGSAYTDILIGDDGANVIDGRGGNDFLFGNGGNDTFIGSAGLDYIDGGAGDDTLDFSQGTMQPGPNVYQNIWVDLEAGTVKVAVGGHTANHVIKSIENVIGTAHSDSIWGDASDNSFVGGDGIDALNGGYGDDRLLGGNGDDILVGGADRDWLFGEGDDDNMLGAAGDDYLYGGDGWDHLDGGADDDFLAGGDGSDRLEGGAGNDVLIGGKGHDDAMIGGAGADLFLFEDGDSFGVFKLQGTLIPDQIWDFEQGEDLIGLSLIDANQYLSGDQAFNFIGTDAFSGAAGELRYEHGINLTRIYGNTDADAAAEFELWLEWNIDLTADDFML